MVMPKYTQRAPSPLQRSTGSESPPPRSIETRGAPGDCCEPSWCLPVSWVPPLLVLMRVISTSGGLETTAATTPARPPEAAEMAREAAPTSAASGKRPNRAREAVSKTKNLQEVKGTSRAQSRPRPAQSVRAPFSTASTVKAMKERVSFGAIERTRSVSRGQDTREATSIAPMEAPSTIKGPGSSDPLANLSWSQRRKSSLSPKLAKPLTQASTSVASEPL
mmetsp:Transcript_86160/g.229017  ORF Transcript_86160/g.229017 Transcript_86160/m.229017 type:complete len:221 (-) Transcript_86160:7-669(-)